MNIDANWPGSSHDSHVFFASELRVYLEATVHKMEDGIILGDSGYGCRSFLLTPFLNPQNRAQEKFNSSHCKTRNVIERVNNIKMNITAHYVIYTHYTDQRPAEQLLSPCLYGCLITISQNSKFKICIYCV